MQMHDCNEQAQLILKETMNLPKGDLAAKEDVCFQHQFVTSIPIRSLNIYLNQMFFGVIQNLNPMCLVNCENCGVKFISVEGAEEATSGRLFERTFAAYYNTSQLQISSPTNT